VFKLSVTDSQGAQAEDEMVLTVIPANTGAFVLRINAGGGKFINEAGEVYLEDNYYDGGNIFNNPITIINTNQSQIYQTERYGEFQYDIPVPKASSYTIKLHFAEIWFSAPNGTTGGIGSRVYEVFLEENIVMSDYDMLLENASASAIVKVFENISIDDGFVSLKFNSIVENPKIAAIEIIEYQSVQLPLKTASLENQKGDYSIVLYPNPAKDKVNIVFKKDENPIKIIKIYDMSGRLIKEISHDDNYDNNVSLELYLEEFSNGVYNVHFYTLNQRLPLFTKQLIINK
ncbi:malectin domain-containing carbohydrate-binding protein, partial [Flavobacterium sp. ASW18X]|uniref:malectin domain-containing carbohydrate-binding protein n=1 Tax=Flavobacterium sp. ASW18X TaxID=2572595 RepID=UPI0010AEB412